MDRPRWQRNASAPDTPAAAAAACQTPGGEPAPQRAARAERKSAAERGVTPAMFPVSRARLRAAGIVLDAVQCPGAQIAAKIGDFNVSNGSPHWQEVLPAAIQNVLAHCTNSTASTANGDIWNAHSSIQVDKRERRVNPSIQLLI